ncbi:MAG: tryptophan 7-halogenase [Oscillatoria sp. PMC 1051.18]|uniref:NAD(P)/FAD-dependent oxidoreductase n=1 Tax=Oscillatoria salina TaxID=331517 RepID=UPI0013B5CE9D|nr:tryptophan 7-halogenase [Oscillatoria salina]MBZ8180966.1 FAD-dependent oxidoreductase [Oscillatoria salina IIICB1]MEC4891783.1 tryptophan 7-halogenase [Oscillatoria sp. PMC 1050.18]MEC5028403.1 tryptophan 7-halogenase [Oscillatoria sp. PMC 1051.18]NET89195.1 FAD-dependent oxidoreductase [Kamptonema sp. SIO1D9]
MQEKYQVIILGSGMAGTILGTILAKNKVKVLIIDKGSHPKFTIGESTIPYTTQAIAGISDLFDIPELHPGVIGQKLERSCGVKKNVSFAYHHLGQEQQKDQITQANLDGAELHFFRQDLDSYLLHLAIHYGAVVKQNCQISDIEFDSNGKDVFIASEKGEKFSGLYVVDASGYSSVLAKKFDLREKPTHLKTHTRTLFTHMLDVSQFEACVHSQKVHGMPGNFHEGTLHHLFDGGWMWVIPFNNHKNSTNPLCSVGLQLDSRRFPKTDIPPEQEFFEFISQYPSIYEQFKNAKSVREWISTDRLQYSSKKCVGDRYCLLHHSYGFVDPLFSRGLASTCDCVKHVAQLILEAVKDNDFSESRFEELNEIYSRLLDLNDELVYGALISFKDFELWKTWHGVWQIPEFVSFFELAIARLKFKEGDREAFLKIDQFGNIKEVNYFLKQAVKEIEQVEKGTLSPEAAQKNLENLLEQVNLLPEGLKFSLSKRSFQTRWWAMLEFVHWLNFKSSPEVKQYYEGFKPMKTYQLLKEVAKR